MPDERNEPRPEAVAAIVARVGYGSAQASQLLRDASPELLERIAKRDFDAIDELCAQAEAKRIKRNQDYLKKVGAEPISKRSDVASAPTPPEQPLPNPFDGT